MSKNKILSIQDVSKSYGKTKALQKANLELKPGIYALLGHNGAGKTTLLNILATVLESDAGTVRYGDQNIKDNLTKYRSIIGYMPQQQQLMPYLSVESFMYYMAALKGVPKKDAAETISTILKDVNMSQYQSKSLSSLSGGMKQRLLIGQALLNNPQILLLDEPTAGLDPVERRTFRELIAAKSQSKIVILATHVISDVEWIANEIIIMKDGLIKTQATQQQLFAQTKVYETMESIDSIKEKDPELKVVNQIRLQDAIKTRYISKNIVSQEVQTTLDDVYLDWLG